MDITTYHNIILLQSPQKPIDQIYNIKFTLDFLIRAPAAQKLLIFHFLLTELDPARSAQAFSSVLTTKSSRISIREIVRFRQILHIWASELQNSAKFEIPSQADLGQGNAKNLKTFYCLSKFVLRIKSQQLIRKLEATGHQPFSSICQSFSVETHANVMKMLKQEINQSAEEFEILRKISEKQNLKMGELFKNGQIQQSEGVELVLEQTCENALEKLENFVFVNSQSLEIDENAPKINRNELLMLQKLGTRTPDNQINLYSVFLGQNQIGIDNENVLKTMKLQELKVDFGSNLMLQKLVRICDFTKAKVQILQDQIAQIEPLYVTQIVKKQSNPLNLQHFSQLGDFTKTAREAVQQYSVDELLDQSMQSYLLDSALSESELKFSKLTVLEHRVQGVSNGISRTQSQFLPLANSRRLNEGTLASRLKRTVGGEYNTQVFVGGQTEGVREFMRQE